MPGKANSARMPIARTPPNRKNSIEVMKYRLPITLWSVVTNHFQEMVPSRRVGAAISVAVAVRRTVVIYSPSFRGLILVFLLRPSRRIGLRRTVGVGGTFGLADLTLGDQG